MSHEIMFYAIGKQQHFSNARYTDMPFQHH